ncbi:unnamed protein product [Schistosoma curassoni]|uniref:Pre-mRNA-splicing factor SYF2 n=1 Tax=Schistosoma curassoni TaxID=6186 RepID=A0A183K729_9TREM|nr:unnamed protein product [Schistosoma curassoni]
MLSKERANYSEDINIDNADKNVHPKPGNRREEEALEAAERAKRNKQDGIAKQVYRTGVGKFIHDVDQFDSKAITNKHGKDIDSSLQMNEDVLRKKQKLLLKSQLTDFSSW